MADVRSMLAGERTSRKMKHPHAAYTSTGQLMCSVCRAPIKSANLWENHLRSEGHTTVVKKTRQSRAVPSHPAPALSKKRKAEPDEEPENKRVRSGIDGDGPSEGQRTRPELDEYSVEPQRRAATNNEEMNTNDSHLLNGSPSDAAAATVDPDEWRAFERDMESMAHPDTGQTNALSALQAAPTISVAPLTAQELAAQAREEQSIQKGARDAELADEREDASRQMEEELGHMEQLDVKMRDWRAKREALRVFPRKDDGPAGAQTVETVKDPPASRNNEDQEDQHDTDDDDEDDDEDMAWRGLGGV